MEEGFKTTVKALSDVVAACIAYTVQRAGYVGKPSLKERSTCRQARRMLLKHLDRLEQALAAEDQLDGAATLADLDSSEK